MPSPAPTCIRIIPAGAEPGAILIITSNQGGFMGTISNTQGIINSIIYSGLGVVLLMLTFIIIDLVTPHYSIWKEILEKQNVALGILLGAFLLGVAIIIAAAVRG